MGFRKGLRVWTALCALPGRAGEKPVTVITFVCQEGELEVKSALLAASLRQFHPNLALHACVPNLPGSQLQKSTRAIFRELDVQLCSIESPFGAAYPIANKIACLALAQDGDLCIFLDSDILCRGQLDLARFARAEVSVKPADKYTFGGTDADWQKIYAAAGVKQPSERVFSTAEHLYMPRYYNSGVLGSRRPGSLGQKWLEIARKLDADPTIPNRRPWLDQISLPVATAALQLPVAHLSERENFPLNNLPLPPEGDPRFPLLVHYHSPQLLSSEPGLVDFVQQLKRQYPALEQLHPHPGWLQLFRRSPLPGRAPGRAPSPKNLVLTGIPRSGTSLLARGLDAQQDVVAINEPDNLEEPLTKRQPGRELQLYFREQRRKILAGEPVLNKLDAHGAVVQDTFRREHALSPSNPEVQSRDFVLAVKNPLAFMARLPLLMEETSDLALIACIRHPMDTLGSWAASFRHLKLADISRFPLQGRDDPHLTPWQGEQLDRVAEEPHPHIRRCLLWRYLAELLWRQRAGLQLVHYESLCSHPGRVLAQLLGEEGLTSRPVQSSPAESRHYLTSREQRQVTNLCGDMAEKFGYII